MERLSGFKNNILGVNNLLTKAKTDFPDITYFRKWQGYIEGCIKQIDNQEVRTAVIGTLKSGKSTLVNSVTSKDILKRAAGVITSVITEVRNSGENTADIYLNPVEDIDSEINFSIVRMPLTEGLKLKNRLDKVSLLDSTFKDDMAELLNNPGLKRSLDVYTRDRYYKYLEKLIEGYDRVIGHYRSGRQKLTYKLDKKNDFMDWISDEKFAVYVKNTVLKFRIDGLNPGIVIFDSQGTDSVYFRHNYLLNNFLMQTNILIYVISSRIGFRRADLNLIEQLRKNDMLDNIIFVLNIDINEHNSIDEIKRMVEMCRDDILNFIESDKLVMFSFSALYHLMKKMDKRRELENGNLRMQFDAFKVKKDFINYSERNYNGFIRYLNENASIQKTKIIERGVSSRIKRWVDFNTAALGFFKDSMVSGKKEITSGKLRYFIEKFNNLDSIIEMKKKKLKEKTVKRITRLFQNRSDTILKYVIKYVRGYSVDPKKLFIQSNSGSFGEITSLLYQKFLKDFDEFLRNEFRDYSAKCIEPVIEMVLGEIINIEKLYNSELKRYISEYNGFCDRNSINFFIDTETEFKFKRNVSKKEFKLPEFKLMLKSVSLYKINSYLMLASNFADKGLKYMWNKIFKKKIKVDFDNTIFESADRSLSYIKKAVVSSLTYELVNFRENIKYLTFLNVIDDYYYELYNDLKNMVETIKSNSVKSLNLDNMDKDNKIRIKEYLKNINNYFTEIKSGL